MKILFIFLAISAFFSCKDEKKTEQTIAGTKTITDSALTRRVNEYLQLSEEKNFEGMVDYLYPRIFEIAPREAILAEMKTALGGDEIDLQMDSLKIDSIYPSFKMGKEEYAKVKYSMLMKMNVDPETADFEQMDRQFAIDFGKENVRIDTTNGSITIFSFVNVAAIKNQDTGQWFFMNIGEDPETEKKLLGAEVAKKLATYK